MIYFIDLSSGNSGLIVIITDNRSHEKKSIRSHVDPSFASFDFRILSYPTLSFCILHFKKKKKKAIEYTRLWESTLSKHLINADKSRALRKIAEGEEGNIAGWQLSVLHLNGNGREGLQTRWVYWKWDNVIVSTRSGHVLELLMEELAMRSVDVSCRG